MGIAGSPDGIHWKMIACFFSEASNDGSRLMIDPIQRKYILFGRTKYHSPEVLQAWGEDEWFKEYNYGRAVTRLESTDVATWDYTEWLKSPITLCADTRDPKGAEIYTMTVFPYESVFIGLPQLFYNRPASEGGTLLDLQLAVSHDTIHFTRVGDRSAFIPCGGIGQWDRFNNSVAGSPPVKVGDELWFYYSGRKYRHRPYQGTDNGGGSNRCCIGLATVKQDRFVSLGASFDGGTIVTKPVKFAGKKLHLNAKSDFGEIIVQVLNTSGNVMAQSRSVQVDGLDIPVEWESGDLGDISTPVTLRITLKNALLYALWCT
jgi:hypothetical protein